MKVSRLLLARYDIVSFLFPLKLANFIFFRQIPTGLDPDQLHSIYKRIGYLQRPDNLQYCMLPFGSTT